MGKALSSSLYNIYKEARQSSSKLSVLCHGRPTANNILFLYNDQNIPTEAKFINFSHSCVASPLSDLLVLMNDIIDFEELKMEKQKQSLYGYIESSILLSS